MGSTARARLRHGRCAAPRGRAPPGCRATHRSALRRPRRPEAALAWKRSLLAASTWPRRWTASSADRLRSKPAWPSTRFRQWSLSSRKPAESLCVSVGGRAHANDQLSATIDAKVCFTAAPRYCPTSARVGRGKPPVRPTLVRASARCAVRLRRRPHARAAPVRRRRVRGLAVSFGRLAHRSPRLARADPRDGTVRRVSALPR